MAQMAQIFLEHELPRIIHELKSVDFQMMSFYFLKHLENEFSEVLLKILTFVLGTKQS